MSVTVLGHVGHVTLKLKLVILTILFLKANEINSGNLQDLQVLVDVFLKAREAVFHYSQLYVKLGLSY